MHRRGSQREEQKKKGQDQKKKDPKKKKCRITPKMGSNSEMPRHDLAGPTRIGTRIFGNMINAHLIFLRGYRKQNAETAEGKEGEGEGGEVWGVKGRGDEGGG